MRVRSEESFFSEYTCIAPPKRSRDGTEIDLLQAGGCYVSDLILVQQGRYHTSRQFIAS